MKPPVGSFTRHTQIPVREQHTHPSPRRAITIAPVFSAMCTCQHGETVEGSRYKGKTLVIKAKPACKCLMEPWLAQAGLLFRSHKQLRL